MATRVKKLPKVEDMSEEQLQLFTMKKRECDNRALTIVVELLESPISQTYFLERLPHIAQSHYEDITEERAIVKHCGYPLCTKRLPDKLPSRKYKLCSKTNKVYDITTRKNFCSDQCYAASTYLKRQLITVPLWFREKKDTPEFHLLPLDTRGAAGDLIDISITEKIPKDNKQPFSSFLDFTEASLNEMEPTTDANVEAKTTIPESTTKDNAIPLKDKTPTVSNKPSKATNSSKNCKLLGDVVERTLPKVDPIITAGLSLKMKLSKESKETIAATNQLKATKEVTAGNLCSPLVKHIETSFGEWVNFDTLIFVLGEAKLKEIVSDKGDEIKSRLESVTSESSNDFQLSDQYQKLCRKLNLLELEDRKYDQKVGGKDLQPLSDYRILKEENRLLDVKVNAFYQGTMEIPIQNPPDDTKMETDQEELPHLPQNDKNSQSILRRKIFLNGLDKVLPDMLKALQLPAREISGDVRQLVATFDFGPHNIIFKNVQWNLIAIIMIKLLSLRNQRLSEHLNVSTSNTHLNLILMSYKLDFGYLDRLLWWLTDIDRVLRTNVDTVQ